MGEQSQTHRRLYRKMRLQVCEKSRKKDAPNHFFDALPCSSTSTTPARRGSIVGTWFARIPMSPVAAGTFTWMTSAELKIDCNHTIQHRPQSILHYSGLTWWGKASESLILSAASAYPRRLETSVLGALRAAEDIRRSADMMCKVQRMTLSQRRARWSCTG